jgi:hypothetical protein
MPKKKKTRKPKAAPKRKKISKKKAASAKRKPLRKKKPARTKRPTRRSGTTPAGRTSEVNTGMFSLGRRGLGPGAGGQSGDNQGLSRKEDVDSENVEELTEEGQDFEAEVVSGVENAPDADQGEVRTREVPEDDVPEEYDKQ